MSDEAAFVISQSVCAMITAMGMQAENTQRAIQQDSPAYVYDDFQLLINEHLIGHNDVVSKLMRD